MILTCPNCATGFFVADHMIGAEGRRVKCDECGEVWLGGAQARPPMSAQPVAAPASISVEAAPDAQSPSGMFALRKTPPAPRRAPTRRRALIIALAVLALAVVGLIVFQGGVVKTWPATNSAYRALGLKASPAATRPHD